MKILLEPPRRKGRYSMKRLLLIAALLALVVAIPVASAGPPKVTATISSQPVYVGDYTASWFRVTVCGLRGYETPYTITEPDGEVESRTLYPGVPGNECATFSWQAYEVGEHVFSFFDKKGNLLASVSGQALPAQV